MSKPITTTITEEQWHFCKARSIGWHHAISVGINMLMHGRKIEEELTQTQEKLAKMSHKLQETNQRLWDLEKAKEAKIHGS